MRDKWSQFSFNSIYWREISMTKRIQKDNHAKKKAVKLVVLHIRRKLEDGGEEAVGFEGWLNDMEDILSKEIEEFKIADYYDMRRQLNNNIDCIFDVNLRYKLRDSWMSFGKALDKKAKRY